MTAKCLALEKQTLFDSFKCKAVFDLHRFERYFWQYEHVDTGCTEPKLKNAFDFIHEYGYDDFNVSNLLLEIYDKCDGKNNGNAKLITIEYMAEVIAFWETKAFLKEQGNSHKS